MSQNRLNIVLTVFGRYAFGKLKGQVNPKCTCTVDLVTSTDRETGHEESVAQRIARFMKEADTPIYKIKDITPISA